MTNDEAKFLLQGYRPNGQDAENPAFAEALAQAARDPALRAWLGREQAFDAVIAGKLRDVAPPAGLRESILAGTRLSTATGQPAVRSARVWWSGFRLATLAAAAVVTMAGLWFWGAGGGPRVVSLPSAEVLLSTAMADFRGAHPMGHPHADALGAFGAWLEDENTRLSAGVMPAKLDELQDRGCRVIEVAGHALFEICFQRDGQWYHVYFAPRADFDPATVHEEPMFHEQGHFVAASWADEKYVYLVSSTSGIDSLRGLL